jgi:hypothetical protein
MILPYSNPANIKPAAARTLPARLPEDSGAPADDEGLYCVAVARVAEADVAVPLWDELIIVSIPSLVAEVGDLDGEDEVSELAADSESTFSIKELMIDS